MIHLWRRGHIPGLGLVDPDNRYFLLSIPKNASTFLGNVLTANGWRFEHIDRCRHMEMLVVLRDPVTRWLSGFATYATLQLMGHSYGSDHFVEQYNDLTEKLIFDNLVFDDHTTPQSDFVEQLPPDAKFTYFSCNKEQLITKLSKYTGYTLVVDAEVADNDREDNYDTQHIYNFMNAKLDTRVSAGTLSNGQVSDMSLRDRIRMVYAADYNLLKRISNDGT